MYKKTKAEIREAKRLKQKYAPKGGTLAGQFQKIKTSRSYVRKKSKK